MDVLYHLTNKSDNEESLKLNLDELYEKKQQHDMFTISSYNKILTRVHGKIKLVSRQYSDTYHCWYIIPEVLLGIPKYDHKDCTAYIINKLQENGFIVRYTHPNLVFISWNHWVPGYVRTEIKKKTGVTVDGYGNTLDKSVDGNNSNNSNNSDSILTNNNDSSVFNLKKIGTNPNSKDSKKNNYRDINTYKPEGKLIYNNDILKNLRITD